MDSTLNVNSDIIKFDRVSINHHDAYSSVTGQFTARRAGMYQVESRIVREGPAGFKLVVRGEVVEEIQDIEIQGIDNTSPQREASFRGIISLELNDKVHLEAQFVGDIPPSSYPEGSYFKLSLIH